MVDPLSAICCGQCGYDLTGLPRQGRCPECGRVYDLNTGEGLDRMDSPRRRHRGDRVRTLLCVAFVIVVLIAGGALSLVARNPARTVALALVVAAIGSLAALTSFLYETKG